MLTRVKFYFRKVSLFVRLHLRLVPTLTVVPEGYYLEGDE